MNTKEEIATQMILAAWHKGVQGINKTLSILSNEELSLEVTSDRNKGTWIIAHLAATSDSLLKILDLGDHVKPNYRDYFNLNAAEMEFPSVTDIRQYWDEVSDLLNNRIKGLSPDDWFGKHTSISADDFAKETQRNKLNVLMDRTSHLAHHRGQLELLVKK